jgi:hypothetical protein
MKWCLVNDGLERMWKEVVVAYRHLPQRTEENHEAPQSVECFSCCAVIYIYYQHPLKTQHWLYTPDAFRSLNDLHQW